MTTTADEILWDQEGERKYETGVDHGVLYLRDANGVYATGVPWNGLVTVTESPSGAEASAQYADNMKYVNIRSAEEFAATVEAFMYPPEFGRCDGSAEIRPGVTIGQQNRETFGLSYRTKIGNDVAGLDLGYKLHVVYGCSAAPSEKAYGTINDSPEPINFSWDLSTTPVGVGVIDGVEYKPTATLTIASTDVDPAELTAFEEALYGRGGETAHLPLPAAVYDLFPNAA